jgi:hypothetical protein
MIYAEGLLQEAQQTLGFDFSHTLWPALAKNQDANPENISHEIKGKVSVYENSCRGGKFDNVFDTRAG